MIAVSTLIVISGIWLAVILVILVAWYRLMLLADRRSGPPPSTQAARPPAAATARIDTEDPDAPANVVPVQRQAPAPESQPPRRVG